MSYNRLTVPRAYIDLISYNISNGWRDLDDITTIQDDGSTAVTFDAGSEASMFDMKPSNFAQIASSNRSFYIQFDFAVSSDNLSESNFLAILNHNLNDAQCIFKIELSDNADMSSSTIVTTYPNHTKKINAEQSSVDSNYLQPAKNGWSLLTWTESQDNRYMRITFQDTGGASHVFNEDVIMGSIMFGKYIDFRSPNIDINTSIVYDGTSINNSVGGNSYANTNYTGEANWNHTLPWNLTTSSNQQNYGFNKMNGRIQHSLKFDYLTDTEVFAPNWFADQDSHADWYDSDSMHSSFFNRTFGQHLPFLFSINSTSTTTGDYGMFRLANNSFSANQVASRIWNVNMDLIQTW
tara:strand:- start:6514 stop:7566 length:1053 start_codon:yes stop_codon:yes gene_type:complete